MKVREVEVDAVTVASYSPKKTFGEDPRSETVQVDDYPGLIVTDGIVREGVAASVKVNWQAVAGSHEASSMSLP